MIPLYNRPSPGAPGLKPAGRQEPAAHARPHMKAGNKSKLRGYGAASFAGRPLQMSPKKPGPTSSRRVQGR